MFILLLLQVTVGPTGGLVFIDTLMMLLFCWGTFGQTVMLVTVTAGVGFTSILKLEGSPTQPLALVGIAVTTAVVATNGVGSIAVNVPILPVPGDVIPMVDGLTIHDSVEFGGHAVKLAIVKGALAHTV
jgi:hypothetical protein